MTTSIRFQWTCSYMNSVWYRVWDHTGTYEIELRRGVCDYERSISNYDDAGWEQWVVAAVGKISRNGGGTDYIPPETVDAFNAWRLAEHEAQKAKILGQPEKYGTPDEHGAEWFWKSLLAAPAPVTALRVGPRVDGRSIGWVGQDDPTYHNNPNNYL